MSVVATLPRSDRAKAVGALSVVAAGAALLSGGLVPALVIGGTGAFAQHLAGPPRRRRRRAAPLNSDPALKPLGLPLSRTMAKTITFRLLATTLDFSLNYAVIGEFGVVADACVDADDAAIADYRALSDNSAIADQTAIANSGAAVDH